MSTGSEREREPGAYPEKHSSRQEESCGDLEGGMSWVVCERDLGAGYMQGE